MATDRVTPGLLFRARKYVARTVPAASGAWYRWKERRLQRIAIELTSRYGNQVQTGPFQGMKYVGAAAGSALIPKLLGCYEEALHPVFAEVLKNSYDAIIDVGCAEGYYAVGLARTLRTVPVYAYDIDLCARELCSTLAALNGVEDVVTVRGACDIAALAESAKGRTLIVCDCEGFELELLRPNLIDGLRQADLIVELHELVDPSIPDVITSRFAPTHEVRLITSEGLRRKSLPQLDGLSRMDRRLARNEWRGVGIRWAYLRSRSEAHE